MSTRLEEEGPLRGEIYWIDLTTGAEGSEQMGRRPAVVISNDVANVFSKVVVVAAITSKTPRMRQPWNVRLAPVTSPLKLESWIICNQIRTVDKRRLETKAGALSPVDMAALEQALNVALGMTGSV